MADSDDRKDPGQEQREAEAAEAQAKQGSGAVPNVTSGQAEGEIGELKEAVHEIEEQKGDWSKGH